MAPAVQLVPRTPVMGHEHDAIIVHQQPTVPSRIGVTGRMGVVERLRAVEVHVMQGEARPDVRQHRDAVEEWSGCSWQEPVQPAANSCIWVPSSVPSVLHGSEPFATMTQENHRRPWCSMGGMSPPGFTIVLDRRSTSSDDVFQAHSEASAPSSTASKTTVSPRATSPKAVPTKAGA